MQSHKTRSKGGFCVSVPFGFDFSQNSAYFAPMPVTRSSMSAAIKAKLDAYFATTSGSVRQDFSDFLANVIADCAQDAITSAAAYATFTTTVAPPVVATIISAAPGAPCTGTLAITATTTATCVIP